MSQSKVSAGKEKKNKQNSLQKPCNRHLNAGNLLRKYNFDWFWFNLAYGASFPALSAGFCFKI